MAQRRGGIIQFKINGIQYDAKGEFEYAVSRTKREGVVGPDGPHGFKELPLIPYIAGAITDRGNLSLSAILKMDGETVTLELANGKVIALRDAWYAGDGVGKTDEGEFEIRFEGMSGEEIL